MSRRNKRRNRQLVERRATSYGPVPLNDTHTLFGNYPVTATGIRVDNYSADCNFVFRRGVEVIAQSLAKTARRWKIWQMKPDEKRASVTPVHWWLMTRAANHYMTAYNFWELLQSWAKGWGNGYAWILRRNDMTPVGLYPLHPSRVMPRLVRNEDKKSPFPWDLIYQIDGGRETMLPYEILHIKGNPGFDGVTGYNLVQLHENTLAIAQSQNEYAGEFFQNGAVAGGLVELPAHLSPDVVLKYKTDFQNAYSTRGNRHKLAVVDSGVKFTASTVSPENAQLLESRKFSIYEIALMLGVPPTVLGDLTHGSYANSEQQQLALNMLTVHPTAENWRQELDLKMTPEGMMSPVDGSPSFAWDYDLTVLDAADTSTRVNSLHTAVGGPWMSKEEARAEYGLPEEVKGTIYPPSNMSGPPEEKEPDKEPEEKDPEEGGDSKDPKIPTDGNPQNEPRSTSSILSRRDRAVQYTVPVMADAVTRMATKEANAITGHVKHLRDGRGDVFASKAAESWQRQAEQAAAAYTPALTALARQIGHHVKSELRDSSGGQMSDDAAQGYAAKMATKHVEQSKQEIADILTGEHDATKAAEAIEGRAKAWSESRAAECEHELRQAANYFAREAYRAAGCKQVRWAAHPADGDECLGMDGKTVDIDKPFETDPPKHHPPMTQECRCGVMGVK